MTLRAEILTLPLRYPFTIARGTMNHAETVLIELAYDGVIGRGEVAPSSRYGETPTSVTEWFGDHAASLIDPYDWDRLLAGTPRAVRCALDVAAHDWLGQRVERPVWELLGLAPPRPRVTSYTIGLDTIEVMLQKVEEYRTLPVLKVKLGTERDLEIIAAIRDRYTGAIRIDANEGWDCEQAVSVLRELERFEIELCEQPVRAGFPEQLRHIRERVKIPIVADEDLRTLADLPRLIGCVDGINVKLVKAGGIRAALELVRAAKALGMKTMVGCMVESSLLATAAAIVALEADWADIDGPLLLARDPFHGPTYDGGKLILPTGNGLGMTVRAWMGQGIAS